MEKYKWYKASGMLPEDLNMPRNKFGIDEVFVVSMANGDLCCANRWLENSYWFWETDSDFFNDMIEKYGITHWMILERPKTE